MGNQEAAVQYAGCSGCCAGLESRYVVFGSGAKSADGVQVGFTCIEEARKQTLTVPDLVLIAVPSSSNESVVLMIHMLENLFKAPGIDVGYFSDLRCDSKEIGSQ